MCKIPSQANGFGTHVIDDARWHLVLGCKLLNGY